LANNERKLITTKRKEKKRKKTRLIKDRLTICIKHTETMFNSAWTTHKATRTLNRFTILDLYKWAIKMPSNIYIYILLMLILVN